MNKNTAIEGVPPARDQFVTKRQIAAHFQRTPRTIEMWMRTGLLPYFKVGRSVLFRLDDVERHFHEHFHHVRGPAHVRGRRPKLAGQAEGTGN